MWVVMRRCFGFEETWDIEVAEFPTEEEAEEEANNMDNSWNDCAHWVKQKDE